MSKEYRELTARSRNKLDSQFIEPLVEASASSDSLVVLVAGTVVYNSIPAGFIVYFHWW